MNTTYQCTICHSINHAARYHCQHCGTIPAMYSVLGVAAVFHGLKIIETVNATGSERCDSFRTVKANLRTAESIDYYTETV